MSDWVKVTTQQGLDAAIAAKQMRVEIAAAVTLEARVPADGFTLFLKAVSGAWLRLLSGKVVAMAVQLHNDAKCDGGTQIKIVQPKSLHQAIRY